MNIQEYISSGIVESYVLGLADSAERAEFERMCAAHVEIRAAREAFEILLEKEAAIDAIEPPNYIKSKIFAEIEIESQQFSSSVIPFSRNSGQNSALSTSKWLRFLVAASIILLLASTGLNLYFFRQYKEYSTLYDNLVASQQQLAASNNVLQARLQSYESTFALIKDPQMTVVTMPGSNVPTSPDPSSLATVYWDSRTKDVYLLVNKMPEPTADKQYQLWAMVDGKPVDAGVFDTQSGAMLVKMKNIPAAQAFAITLEKKGGSPTPTMKQLVLVTAPVSTGAYIFPLSQI